MNKAIPFIQQLVDATSKHVTSIHFSYVILPPKDVADISVGGEKCAEYKVKTEDFLRNLGPMFSYISAWNYKRWRKDEGGMIIVDAFGSKETIAWRELTKTNKISIVSHGDEVHPLISYADLIAFLTDVKLYNSKLLRDRKLTLKNLEKVWKGVFKVDSAYIDLNYVNKIKWVNEEHIDIKKYMLKPTIFFISDDPDKEGVNEVTTISDYSPMKKSKRLMELRPVKNAINFAALRGASFRFYDPYLDEKYVADGDVLVYAGDKSKKIANYLSDSFDVEVYKAREIGKKLSSLQDC